MLPYRPSYSFGNKTVYGQQVRFELDRITETLNSAGLIDGWVSIIGDFKYASATTITISAGGVNRYSIGDKLRFQNNNSGTYLYVYVVTVADTLLTVIGDTVPNATLTDMHYSRIENPQGFPHWFSWTPTYFGTTSAGSGTYTTQSGRFKITGRMVTFTAYIVSTNHTGTGNLRAKAPIASGASAVLNPISLYFSNLDLTNASVSQVIAYVINNSTDIAFGETRDNNTSIAIAMPTACTLIWSGSYEI